MLIACPSDSARRSTHQLELSPCLFRAGGQTALPDVPEMPLAANPLLPNPYRCLRSSYTSTRSDTGGGDPLGERATGQQPPAIGVTARLRHGVRTLRAVVLRQRSGDPRANLRSQRPIRGPRGSQGVPPLPQRDGSPQAASSVVTPSLSIPRRCCQLRCWVATPAMSSQTGRRFHFWLLVVWVVVGLPVSFVLRQSVPWVVFLSVYAIIATHWAGWSAERPNAVEKDGG